MTAAGEGEAGAAGSHPGGVLAIRDRTESDLGECVRLLAEVHRHDGYPLRWPASPRRFLGTPEVIAAWVATIDGQVVGHVALSVVSPSDAAPRLLGVTSTEPASTGPASTGPASTGPASTGPASTGPASTGPASTGDPDSGEPASTDDPGSGGPGGGGVMAGSGDVGTGKIAMISRLFVATAARGYGAGRALMQRAVQGAYERGLHPLLDVHTANTSAIALYERLGWHFLGSSHAQWGPDRVTIRSYIAPTRGPAGPPD